MTAQAAVKTGGRTDWNAAPIGRALDEVLAAHATGWDGVARTPVVKAERLGEITGCELWVKLENLQYTGAFKERGAIAKLMSLSEEERARGVIAASAGNHAQGVARHARRLGVAATIVMPRATPNVKVGHTEALGATVVLEGDSFEEAYAHAQELRAARDLVFVHPFDDPHVAAGQGTIAVEMLEDAPGIDTLVIPVGGGGLISGMALAGKRLRPELRIIGVQAALYPSTFNAVKGAGEAVGGNTLAEGIAVERPGPANTALIADLVDDVVLVDEHALEKALSLYLTIQKTLAEGAGAAGLAALLAHPDLFQGRTVGTVVCGGNIDTRLLSSILLRDLARSGRMARLRVELMDVPGELVR
ncbi:MAG: threonine ammonia-lyase, partial [Caulobacterales bacterium]|nr:threonine ammonia-lyase [Caulobacterales bacterium]